LKSAARGLIGSDLRTVLSQGPSDALVAFHAWNANMTHRQPYLDALGWNGDDMKLVPLSQHPQPLASVRLGAAPIETLRDSPSGWTE